MPVFIAFITPWFKNSKWCDQESGMAYLLEKKIVPIRADGKGKPYGFLSKYQELDAKKYIIANSTDWPQKVGKDVLKALLNVFKTRNLARETVINHLLNIKNWSSENSNVVKLMALEPFSQAEILKIASNFLKNNQITVVASSSALLASLFQRNITMLNGFKDIIELKTKLNF